MVRRYDYYCTGTLITLIVPEQYIPPVAITLYDDNGNRSRFELDEEEQ